MFPPLTCELIYSINQLGSCEAIQILGDMNSYNKKNGSSSMKHLKESGPKIHVNPKHLRKTFLSECVLIEKLCSFEINIFIFN